MAHVHHHHSPRAPTYLIGLDAGDGASSRAFRENATDFHNILALPHGGYINCVACCWTYLVETQDYEIAEGVIQVFYGNSTTNCFLNGPQGPAGEHSVIQTHHDLNIGRLGPRPTQTSKSYQLYLPANVPNVSTLAVGAPITARLESISITQLNNASQLQGCDFNYTNAALIELCLTRRGFPPFAGTCSSQAPQQEDLPKTDEELQEDLPKIGELKL